MRGPLDELRQVLRTGRPLTGTVTRVTATTIQVATPAGVVTVPSVADVRVGDRVTVSGGQILPPGSRSVQVYSV